ncbi:MAG TPA: hypothetical protein PLJ21_00630 [Pseudobdellovibrionaceae bacterium]|nr:hypothetical protein [Pseudobdellovibrionaceae bacterium]
MFRFIISMSFIFMSCLSFAFPDENPKSDYYCPEGKDPMASMSNNSSETNALACVYIKKHESTAVLIRRVRQLTLSGGVQSYGDLGRLEEYSPGEILFMHTDVKMMSRMLTALRASDRYQEPGASDQITLKIDAYLMKIEIAEDFDFEVQLLGKGVVPSGLPKVSSGLSSSGLPGFSLNFGNLNSNLLKIILGHAKEKNYFLDHRVKYLSISHNEGFHRTLDMEKVYVGSMDKNPSESEQVGLQVMGTARFTSIKDTVQFDSLSVMFGIRSDQLDSKTIQDSPGSRRLSAKYGDPIYLMHKETHYSGEKKGQGFLFYMDGSHSINSILLITATPVHGDSRVYGNVSMPVNAEEKNESENSGLNTKKKKPKNEESSPGEGWTFIQ